MLGSLVPVFVIGAAALALWIRARHRRRAERAAVITTWPEIELNEPYGGWNANAYDAGTGRDQSRRVASRFPARPALSPWAASPRRPR